MRKLIPFLLLLTLACNLLSIPATPTLSAVEGPTVTATPVPKSATAPPTLTAIPLATDTPTPAPSSTIEGEYHLQPGDVTFHPDPQLYSGDIVSLEISAQNAAPGWQEASVNVYVGARAGQPVATGQFGKFGIGERAQATFTWVWDTAHLEGPQTVVITVAPKGASADIAPLDVLTVTVNLLPASRRPMPEPLAHWAEAESACCVFHYLTGTAAARDIQLIESEADRAFAHVEDVLGVKQNQKVAFTLLSRLLGHGGFASDEISLTYMDRNPTGSNLLIVFEHEGTHVLDRSLAKTRPTIMTEGLAVYVAGGHFKPEDLDKRAAALLTLGRYIPLTDLTNNFYSSQHEIGYLEGGGFITHLVNTYGWARFKTFYGLFQDAPSQAEMLDAALRANFGKGLSDIEAGWLVHLRSLPPDEDQIEDLRLTIELYDTLRRYQQVDDPAAYFLTAWLPDGPEARQRGIVADFVRHPDAPENIALEYDRDAAGLRERRTGRAQPVSGSAGGKLSGNRDAIGGHRLRSADDHAQPRHCDRDRDPRLARAGNPDPHAHRLGLAFIFERPRFPRQFRQQYNLSIHPCTNSSSSSSTLKTPPSSTGAGRRNLWHWQRRCPA
ncbi:MAG: hypothetical protein HW418_3014 [Anaerolineales bacterium]|nr:hypothetical protein [Anaerolineales bacterium]